MLEALLLLALQSAPTTDPVQIQAGFGPRDGAGRRELRIDFRLAEGWSVPRFALLPPAPPAAILQLAPPPGLVPLGPRPSSLQEHLRALFLDGPEERLLEPGTSSVLFDDRVRAGAGAALELNVLLYAVPPGEEGSGAARLVRRRYRLPLDDGALEPIAAQPSDWGTGGFLQLGETAPRFELPAQHGDFRLADALGEGFVVVAAQRSCL